MVYSLSSRLSLLNSLGTPRQRSGLSGTKSPVESFPPPTTSTTPLTTKPKATSTRSSPRTIPAGLPSSPRSNTTNAGNPSARETRRKVKEVSVPMTDDPPLSVHISPSSSPREIGARLSRLSIAGSTRKSLSTSLDRLANSPYSPPATRKSPGKILAAELSSSPSAAVAGTEDASSSYSYALPHSSSNSIYDSMRFLPASERFSMESSSPKDSGKYLPDSGQTLPKDIATLLGRNSNRSDIQRFNMAKSSNPRGLVGLSNLGNTCFMNSILQCIFSTPLLMGYFTMGMHKCDLNRTSLPMKGQLATTFADLVAEVFAAGKGGVVGPSSFKRQIEKWAPQFAGYRQQDSQEFLRFMLDGLAEDLNRISKKPKWNIKDDDVEKLSDVDKGRLSWNRYQSVNSSIIFDIFGGQLQSTVTCLSCGYQSVTFEQFLDLSVPIPRTGRSSFSSCQLTECLSEFTRIETLDDKYKCFKCKTWREATKQLQLYKTPEVLVIHIKRFSSRSKLDTCVQFPVRGLSLGPSISKLSGHDLDVAYDLYGISNHMGGLGGGHYIAHVLNHDTDHWYVMDDARVTSAGNMGSPSMPSAYVLFYKKRTIS